MESHQLNTTDEKRAAIEAVEGRPGVYLLHTPKGKSGRPVLMVGHGPDVASELQRHFTGSPTRFRSAHVITGPDLGLDEFARIEAVVSSWLLADGSFRTLNDNAAAAAAVAHPSAANAERYGHIFTALQNAGVFEQPQAQLEQSNTFRFSPFKTLNDGQFAAARALLDYFFSDLADPEPQTSTNVIKGGPGTGKTVVAITILKVLVAIRDLTDDEISKAARVESNDHPWASYMTAANRDLLRSSRTPGAFRVGFVVPQQSLRETLKSVFRTTHGLDPKMVLSPFDLGNATEPFDLLIVDEAHRLQIRHAMPTGGLFTKFSTISEHVADRYLKRANPRDLHQLDWVIAFSRFRVLLVDSGQSVRTNDLPRAVVEELETPSRDRRVHQLSTQMRVNADFDYVSYIHDMLTSETDTRALDRGHLGDYDFRLYDDPAEMYEDILAKDDEHGLSRVSAGYAWPWQSKNQPGDDAPYDIEISGLRLRWNRQATDWINSPSSRYEAGSIHTLQGYDLNWAGVIIGPDLGFDPATQRIVFRPESHVDPTNRKRGGLEPIEIQRLIVNAYEVLLTRGIRGTYVYVCDPALREHLRPYFPAK